MIDSGWVEVVGRRDPGAPAAVPGTADGLADGSDGLAGAAAGPRWAAEFAIGVPVLVLGIVLALAAHALRPAAVGPGGAHVFAAAEARDLRFALELFHRENGHYPENLKQLETDHWIAPGTLGSRARPVRYDADAASDTYQLEVTPSP
jgi:hypothetical protein